MASFFEIAIAWLSVPGVTLCRQASATQEAQENGGGYVYFTLPDHRSFPTVSGRRVIDENLVVPVGDGLIDDCSQQFRIKEKSNA